MDKPNTRSVFCWAILVCAVIWPARAAVAQARGDGIRRLERQLRQVDETYRLSVPSDLAISERLVFDYGGSVRFGFLASDDQYGSTRILRQTDGVLYVRAELDGAHRFFGRLRFLYNDYNGGDSFDGRGDELDEPIGDRYWYQFDLRGLHLAQTGQSIDYNVGVKVGRQFVQWGSGLAFSDVLYAGLVDLEYGDIGLVGLAGRTPRSSVVDFDSSRPGFDSDTDRAFYGGMLEYRGSPNHRPYVSYLVQRDENDRDFRVFRTLIGDYPTHFNYDSEYLAIGSRGALGPQLAYRAEVVYETGEGLSNSFDANTGLPVSQTKEDIEAWAGGLMLIYLLRDEHDTRFDLEFVGASGDDDRVDANDTFGGNRSGTNDNGFNSIGYVNTGLALAPDVSNLLMLRLGYSTSPQATGAQEDWLRFGIDGFLFAKADQSAPVSVRSGHSTFLGGEIDFLVDWRVTSDVSLSMRYGVFLPGDAMKSGTDDPRHFFYAGVIYGF